MEGKNEGGENSNGANHAENNTFGHDKAEIQAQRKSHKTKCDEASDSSGGRTDDGTQGSFDSFFHRFFGVFVFHEMFAVGMPKENRIVHSNGELQHGGERLCYVRYFTEEIV